MKKILIYFAAFLLGFVIFLLMIAFPSPFTSFVVLIIAALFFFAYKISSSFDLEFEYILTNGELDVDKITHKSRRKRLLTVHCKSFIEFKELNKADDYFADANEYEKVIDASSKSDSYTDYCAVFYINGQKIKLIFNPTQKMIDTFKLYAPRVVK